MSRSYVSQFGSVVARRTVNLKDSTSNPGDTQNFPSDIWSQIFCELQFQLIFNLKIKEKYFFLIKKKYISFYIIIDNFIYL